MIATIDWFPIALLGLGFLTGASTALILVTPHINRLCDQVIFWRHRHDQLLENYRLMDELATQNARLAIELRNKLAERERWNLADDDADGDWWKRDNS